MATALLTTRPSDLVGTLSILDKDGDTRIQWDRSNPAEVGEAEARFNELKARRYLAYKVNRRGDRGEVLHAFDASAERIIMSPPMVGG
jgi:hypothetical protein